MNRDKNVITQHVTKFNINKFAKSEMRTWMLLFKQILFSSHCTHAMELIAFMLSFPSVFILS